MSGRVSVRVLLGPIAYAASVGLDASRLLAEVGVSAELLNDINAYVPLVVPRDLFARIEAETGEAHVGLRAAEQVGPAAFDVLRYLGASNPTLGDSLPQFVRWFPLLNSAARASVSKQGRGVRLVCDGGPTTSLGPHGSDYVVACTVRGFQEIGSARVCPLEVQLRGSRRGSLAPYERFFGCAVVLAAKEDAIVFSAETLSTPTRAPDATLNALLQQHLQSLERSAPQREKVREQVEQSVVPVLNQGAPAMGATARRLGMSSRTLQRRLEKEGTTFREILRDVRERLAQQYLQTAGLPVHEVAFLLGFTDIAAFYRAFRSWTGRTPGRSGGVAKRATKVARGVNDSGRADE